MRKSCPRTRERRGRRDPPAAALAFALGAAAILAAASARAGDPGLCGPFSAYEGSADEVCRESGVQASESAAAIEGLERLAAGPIAERRLTIDGEALLALPKGEDGTIPLGFELAADATITDSFFSTVLCATIARISGPRGRDPLELIESLPDGAAVVPHHQYLAAAAEVRDFEPPPDPYREYQYALTQLEAERAWSVSEGEGVTVALLDSAPATSHPDLGSVELVHREGLPDPTAATHGTLMAGVLAATSGNAIGIAGIAPKARIVAVAVCQPSDDGANDVCPLYDVLRGLDVAWEAGASVFNLSLVGPSDPLLERAVARLERLGRVVVAAAGNEGGTTPRYPAAYPSVVGVGAVDRDGALYARGNTGLAVELFAPGVEILSTRPPDRFAFGDGTSLAAAHVSGALAVLVGSGLEPGEARRRLTEATAPIADARAGRSGRVGSLCASLAAIGRPCRH